MHAAPNAGDARMSVKRRKRPRGVTLHRATWDAPHEVAQDNAPTPERQAKGSWTVATGTRAWREETATHLWRAHREGAISLAQREAGDAFYALRYAAIPLRVPGSIQRDSLDILPRGGGETSPEYAARILARDSECAAALGPDLYGAANVFIVDGQSLGRFDPRYIWWRDVVNALTMLEIFFGTGRKADRAGHA
jgi:hypothetical protein